MNRFYKIFKDEDLAEEMRRVPYITDEPKFHYFLTVPKEELSSKYDILDTFGQGFDTNPEKAKDKSMGEMLERLCLINPPKKFLNSKFILNGRFIRPSEFFCYSIEQHPDREEILETLDNCSYRWLKSKNISTGKDIYVPAQNIYLSSIFGDENSLRKEQISTGAAFGMVGENRAFKSGFLESVERDGVMGFFLQNQQERKMYNFPNKINHLINYLERYQLETHIFDATSDLKIPTSIAVIVDRTGIGSAVNVGSKSDLNYLNCITGSIMEAIQCRRSRLKYLNTETVSEDKIHSLIDRLIYWEDKDRLQDIGYLTDQVPGIDYQKLQRKIFSLAELVQGVKDKGYDIIVTDITLPEIKKHNFETLKVTIPQLHPLYLDERAKSLYSKHFGEIKNNLKLKPHPVT
ncbi:YcaO-like family protein [Patescibacteria group bacterium]|nr:YcaO-like family protein [Patescibacteria group bacterium]